jgi:hypothetical protein
VDAVVRAEQSAFGRLAGWLAGARGWFFAGALASLAGFALPWFRVSRSYEWWYGGWGLLTTNEPDLWWIAFIFLAYTVLVLAGYWLLGLGPEGAGAVAALAVATALATLIVVALAAADAVNDQGRVYRLDLNLGLFLLIPGHATMIVAAVAALLLQFLAALSTAQPEDVQPPPEG